MLRYVTAPDGVRIACEVSGEGPPLIMVHGAGSARWGFDLVRPHLERRFTLWAVDRRGRGDSGDADDDGYAIEREFEDVAAVVREAGSGALLFGHSYGGLVSSGAARRLDGLPRLALYEAPMGGVLADDEWMRRYEARLDAGEPEAATRDFMHDVGGYTHAELDAIKETPVWRARVSLAHTVPRELRAENAFAMERLSLGELEAPCMLLVGTESPEWARRSTDAFSAAIPGASVKTLDGEGHGAAMSAPERLARELEGFFASVRPLS